jgi:broad specificity phosphatase PhoE
MSHATASAPPCRRLYLVRHGETLYGGDRDGVFRGGDLTEQGYRQIEALAELLAEVPLDAIYASPLGRAQATAETIARRNGAPVTTVASLREIEPGDVMGKEMAQIFTAVRAFFASAATDWDTPYLGGETYRQLRERVWPLIADHGRRSDWRRVAVVAHGGVNNAILGRILGVEGPRLANVEQDFGCVNIIDYLGEQAVLRLVNFTAYDPLKTGLEVSSMDVLKSVLETALRLSLDEDSPSS